jgi:8-oxo-dGTP pyrophosphatase MutT (NUDIX family)
MIQIRDNKGQWAEMGGGVIGYIDDGMGGLDAVVAQVVGASKDGKTVEVEVLNHPDLGDGIYTFPSDKVDGIQGILPDEAVKGLPKQDVVPTSEKLAQAVNMVQLMQGKKTVPSGWTKQDVAKTPGGPDAVYKLDGSDYSVEVYYSLTGKNQKNAMGGTEIAEGAQNVGTGVDGKMDPKSQVLVLKRDASSYKGEGETEVVARTQSWGDLFAIAKKDQPAFDKAVKEGSASAPEAPVAETRSADDYVAAVAKKAKADPAKIDSFLSDFIEKFPNQKFSQNFEGDPDNATSELIGRLAKDGADKDAIATEIAGIANDLPANEKFDAVKKNIMSLVDAVLELEDKDFKKDSKKKIAEIPAPEAETPQVEETPEPETSPSDGGQPPVSETPTLDSFDEPKMYEKISKGQLENLEPGQQVMVLPKHGAPSPYDNWNKGLHKHSVFTKNEDGTFSDVWGKSYSIDKLWTTRQSTLKDENGEYKKYDNYEFMFVGKNDAIEPYLEKDPAKAKWNKYVTDVEDYEEIKKIKDDAYNAWLASWKDLPEGQTPDENIKAALNKRHQEADSLFSDVAKKKHAKDQAAWHEANEARDWTEFRVEETPNLAFIENSPVGTVVSFTTTTYFENEEVQYEDLKVVATKIGPDQWKMEDDAGHFDYDKYTNKDVWNDADTIDYIPPYLELEQEPFTTVDLNGLKQVSGAQGSNAGGVFEDADGNKFYVKFPEDKLHAENEVLASRLYKALGVNAVDMQIGEKGGKDAVFSPMAEGSKKDFTQKVNDPEYRKKVQEHFAVDAWLANWDVAGTGFDNIITDKDGNPLRVDPGGSLLFRAQGSPKGKAFGDEVGELESLSDGSNMWSAEVFGEMTEDDKKKSAAKLLNISDEDIDAIVAMTVTDPAQAEFLAGTLKNRRKYILDQYDLDDTTEAAPEATDESDVPAAEEIVEEPAAPGTPELTGYTIKQNANGVWYPEEKLSPEDYYALRNGEKVPPQLPFLPRNTMSGDTLYFDKDGVKRWGQYGAAGSVLRRKKEDGSYEYLVVKRNAKASTDGGVWSVPGGSHDNKADSENPSSTATRELKEELGWKLDPEATPSASYKNQLSDDWAYDYEVFDVENDLDPKMGGELTEAKWVSADELKQMQADGELHQSFDADTVANVLDAADKAEYAPTTMSDGKWWSKNDATPFRKGKSSEIVKGDVVTVKGGTGERDVVVTSDLISEDGKVTFDFINPENGKTGTYTWDADSNASIMSGHPDAEKFVSSEEQPTEQAPEAEAPEVEAPVEEVAQTPEVDSVEEYDLSSTPVKVWNMKDDSVIANFGLNKAVIEPDVNGTYSAIIHYGVSGEKIGASFFDSKEAALNWVGDQVAAGLGEDINPISSKGVGEASKGVQVLKKGNFNLATDKAKDTLKNMIETADLPDEEKQKLQNILDKPGLNHGETGHLFGKLKGVPSKTADKDIDKTPQNVVDPADIPTKEVEVGGGKKIVDAAMSASTGMSGHYFKDEEGNDLGHVAPSQEVAGTWEAKVKSENATTSKTYTDEESALASFGQDQVANGTFETNPYELPSGDGVQTLEDAQVPPTVNHDLTPVNPQDVIDANLIMDQLLGEHPDHEVLPNGDVVLQSKTITNKYGKKFKYDVVVRRTKKERFFAYVMETDLQTGERRAAKPGRRGEHHSYKALLGSISQAKGVLSNPILDPREWFGKNKKKVETLPSVLSEEVDVTPQLSDWIDSADAGSLASGIADYLADLGSNNQTFAKEVIEAQLEAKGLPKEFLSDVINIMAQNKAQAAAGLPEGMFEKIEGPSQPHLSYDGQEIKNGDYVDWTDPKTGKVYRGYVVKLQYNHNSKDYKYSDQTLVVLPEYNTENGYDANHQRWRVSSNLKVVEKGAAPSEPFFPKAKEKATQESISTGDTNPYTEPKFVPKTFEPKVEAPAAEAPKTEAPAAPTTPAKVDIPDDMGTATLDESGMPVFTVGDNKFPTYMNQSDLDAAAILGTSNPKKWADLEPGDLVQVNGQWKHVLAVGEDENGNMKFVFANPTDGYPASKVYTIDDAKKPLLNTTIATVKPEVPLTPASVAKAVEPEAAPDEVQYNKGQMDMFGDLIAKAGVHGGFADEKLTKLTEDVVQKMLLGEDITQAEMHDVLEQILNAPYKNSSAPATPQTKEQVQEVVDAVNESLGTSSESVAVQDAVNTATSVAEALPEPTPSDVTYNNGVKQLTTEELVTGAKASSANFKFVGNDVKGKDLKVGDLIRRGNGNGTRYYQIVAVEGRNKVKYVEYFPENSWWHGHYGVTKGQVFSGSFYWNNRVYRPSDKFLKSTDYFEKSNVGVSGPASVEVKVVDGVKTLPSVDAVKNAGVDKKSEAGNAAFGIGEDLGDGVTPSMIGMSQIELWKHGFNDQKVKTGNDKYVITGGIVTDKDGNSAGIVTKTDKDNGTVSVTWLSGPEAGKSTDNLPATSVNDSGNWMSPQAAGEYGVAVDAQQIETGKAKIAEKIDNLKAQHAKKIEQEKKLAAIEAKKKAAIVKGAGASLEQPAEVLAWNQSAFEDTPSLEKAVEDIHSKKGLAASFGQQVAVDSTQIEDNKVTVSAIEKGGKPVTKLNFTLTSWTADGANGAIQSILNNPEGKKVKGIKVTKLENVEGGLMKAVGDVDSYFVGGGNGYTYEMPLKDANGNVIGTVRVLRAQDGLDTPTFAGKSTSSSNGPLAFHNRVEVVFDGVATPAQIEQALKSVGVTEARPATPADTRIAMENRLITLFGDVPNGTENLTGDLRKEVLDDIQKDYGITVDDLVVSNHNGVINFEIPKETAEKFAKEMNFEGTLRHGFEPPSWASKDYGKYFYEELVLGFGSGGVRSAADRALHGIYSVPGSGNADINNTGGSYVFTGKNSTSNVGSGRPVQIHTKGSKLLSRLGLYGNTGDSWGALKGKQLQTLGKNALSEVMVKGAITWGDVDHIALSPQIYSSVIAYFQAQGVTEINGIALLNFFKKK